ncbi:MAG: hypothetical protein R2774_13880 [Saprospiraceae bacterium]
MRQIFILVWLLSFTQISFTQKDMSQGSITLEIIDVQSDDPQMQQYGAMMKGSKNSMTFNQSYHLSETEMMGGMMTIVVKVDQEKKMMDMLFSMMGNKYWVESSTETLKTQKEKDIAKLTKLTFDKTKTKNILGYECYEMTIENPEMEDMKVTGYITESIKSKANTIRNFEDLELPGFPLGYSINAKGMTLIFEATSISENVDVNKFDLNTTGFTKMTMEEFQSKMGTFGG